MSKEQELHLLRRITILDKTCSCPLYDKVISWKTEDHSPGTAAKLISLFNSIAITFNDFNKDQHGKIGKDSSDRIRRVIFEQSSEQQRKSKSNYSKYSTGLPSLGGRAGQAKASTSASRFMMAQNPQSPSNSELEIFLQTSGSVHVAIFFKPACYIEDSYEPQLLRDITHDFLQRYESKLREYHADFLTMSKDQELARNNYDYMPAFKDFEPIIDDTSGFTIKDISSPTQQHKKLDVGTHILPLSSDLVMNSTGRPNQLGLASGLGSVTGDSYDSVQPKFLPPLSQPSTPSAADANAQRVQKEQRNQRRAMQQELQPPLRAAGGGGAGGGGGLKEIPLSSGAFNTTPSQPTGNPTLPSLKAKGGSATGPIPMTAIQPQQQANNSLHQSHGALPRSTPVSNRNHGLDDDDLDGMEDD